MLVRPLPYSGTIHVAALPANDELVEHAAREQAIGQELVRNFVEMRVPILRSGSGPGELVPCYILPEN